jgi:hypothetical protein
MLTYVIGISLGNTHLMEISILPVLLLILLTENFVAAQMEKGSKEAVKLTLHTLGVSIICYLLVTWHLIRELILGFPEIIFIALIINIALGRWTGLRLLEYYRFNKLITVAEQEQEE